jgi:hypothetical protein
MSCAPLQLLFFLSVLSVTFKIAGDTSVSGDQSTGLQEVSCAHAVVTGAYKLSEATRDVNAGVKRNARAKTRLKRKRRKGNNVLTFEGSAHYSTEALKQGTCRFLFLFCFLFLFLFLFCFELVLQFES